MHLVLLLYTLFAFLFTIQKHTLNYAEPFFIIGARMFFAGVVLLLFVWWQNGRVGLKIKLQHIKWLIILAVSNIYLTNILEIWAIKHMVTSKASLLYSLSPFVAAIMAFLVLGERTSRKKGLGMLVGFFGLLPVVFMQTHDELASGTFFIFTFAELSIIGAVFCSVYGWIMLKKMVSEYKYSMLLANGYSMALGGTLALAHSYCTGEQWSPVPVNNNTLFIINTLIMCLISNFICYNLYGHLLKRFSVTFMSFAGLVTPLVTSLFGFVLLGETVTWHFYVSLALFSMGLVMFYREEILATRSTADGSGVAIARGV